MRHSGLVLGLALTFSASAVAQQNQQPQRAQPPVLQPENNARLDALLAQWEAKMTGIKSLRARIAREYDDKTFKTKELYVGAAYFQTPNLARLDLQRQDNKNIFERFVCTGQFTYQYVLTQKQIRVYDMGAKKGQKITDDNFLSFLIGMKAAEAKSRYDIRISGEDANYVYLRIAPRNSADLADFSLAELALTQKTFNPRTLRYTEANGNLATWDIPFLELDVPLDRNLFQQPATPPGWELKKMPRMDAKQDGNVGAQPRVIRPQGPG